MYCDSAYFDPWNWSHVVERDDHYEVECRASVSVRSYEPEVVREFIRLLLPNLRYTDGTVFVRTSFEYATQENIIWFNGKTGEVEFSEEGFIYNNEEDTRRPYNHEDRSDDFIPPLDYYEIQKVNATIGKRRSAIADAAFGFGYLHHEEEDNLLALADNMEYDDESTWRHPHVNVDSPWLEYILRLPVGSKWPRMSAAKRTRLQKDVEHFTVFVPEMDRLHEGVAIDDLLRDDVTVKARFTTTVTDLSTADTPSDSKLPILVVAGERETENVNIKRLAAFLSAATGPVFVQRIVPNDAKFEDEDDFL